jgi:hypothetical protein
MSRRDRWGVYAFTSSGVYRDPIRRYRNLLNAVVFATQHNLVVRPLQEGTYYGSTEKDRQTAGQAP